MTPSTGKDSREHNHDLPPHSRLLLVRSLTVAITPHSASSYPSVVLLAIANGLYFVTPDPDPAASSCLGSCIEVYMRNTQDMTMACVQIML